MIEYTLSPVLQFFLILLIQINFIKVIFCVDLFSTENLSKMKNNFFELSFILNGMEIIVLPPPYPITLWAERFIRCFCKMCERSTCLAHVNNSFLIWAIVKLPTSSSSSSVVKKNVQYRWNFNLSAASALHLRRIQNA